MDNILKHPKSTILGIIITVLFGLLAMIHNGHIDLASIPDIPTVIPMMSTLILGALSTDNSAMVKLFFDDWKTTAIGIASAVATAVLGTMAAGQLSNKVLGLSAIAGIYGWVSTHKGEPPPDPPPRLPPSSD